MAAIPGHIKNEVVVIGCHRDAWVMGAADPTSGTVSLLEIVKGLGVLLKSGWAPLRTIVIASWDAEEYGLIGSTEWGEDFSDWISENVVTYLNVDVSVDGSRWNVAGSPSLAHLIKDVALNVDHPTFPGKKLWDARNDEGPYKGLNLTIDQEFLEVYEQANAERKASKTSVYPLGSGSDFTVFLQRLGVRSGLRLYSLGCGVPLPLSLRQSTLAIGTKESREATLKLTTKHAPKRPTAWIDVYYPVLDTGLDRNLSIINDAGLVEWKADLDEDGDPRDVEAHKYRTAVPTWHGFSRAGDVTGELIYANYGTQEDYAELVAVGTNFTGKIVITRYGGIGRGLKIQGAQELGAAGVLIYSDPRDDGYVTVANGFAPYPAGPARNPTSVERGSVQYATIYPGDPTTPGYPAYEDAERTEATNIPAIPSLPISWSNAQRLLEEIGDIYVEDGKGSKRLSGNTSRNKIRLVNNVDNKVTPIWNTMAAIPGHIKNEIVVIGCHRDAWVMGAADPVSGTVSLLEIVKGLGILLRSGWTPLRTIVIASWDGEEHGLIGSTEWGEDFSDWILENVVSYLNVDVSVAGSRWNAAGSPSLAHLIKDAALTVDHPTFPGKKLWDARNDDGPYKGLNLTIDQEFLQAYEQTDAQRKGSKTGVDPLGTGSDFTVFLQRLGVASADQSFLPSPWDAVYHYHSIYDSRHWLEVYADPGFYRHVAVAKHLGLMGLKLADSLLIPLNTTQYALELSDYLTRVEALIPDNLETEPDFSALRAAIADVQAASLKLDTEKQAALKDFEKLLKYLPPYPPSQVPRRRLRHSCRNPQDQPPSFITRVKDWIKDVFGVPPTMETAISWEVAKVFGEDSWEGVLGYAFSTAEGAGDEVLPPWVPRPIKKFIEAARRLGRANKALIAFERGFISEGGIKDREWYKHLGVAPGKWLGYGATTFPALTEAITIEKNITLVDYEARRLTGLINKLAERITPT
ncbi:Zn-dependent exopeptidase [Macrolepiota fuliginosa MF-IS2]|uniref:Zn-dependent exopeptidase n=1 Tax=Macrolepiota fuliginosa MF-IS2 TaxID=1400762 RepID=A0A9P5XL26_9AGAR|nr:Zn-dependent exopeptidase [Macrolepiota fuliginosa MF-IS2]